MPACCPPHTDGPSPNHVPWRVKTKRPVGPTESARGVPYGLGYPTD